MFLPFFSDFHGVSVRSAGFLQIRQYLLPFLHGISFVQLQCLERRAFGQIKQRSSPFGVAYLTNQPVRSQLRVYLVETDFLAAATYGDR